MLEGYLLLRRQRSIRATLFLSQLLLCFVLASAQPTGSEQRQIHSQVEALQERIATIGQQVAHYQQDTQLYAARGSLYVDLYRTLYGGSYLSHFYGDKPRELAAAAIATKAIVDFDKAIAKSPSADLYCKRGEMYEVRWNDAAWTLSTNVYLVVKWPDDSWESLAQEPTDKREIAVLDKFLTNMDFAAAVNDYTEALRLSTNQDQVKEIHTKFARLYIFRTERIPLELPAIRKMVNEPNRYHYSLWADFDNAIEHMSKSDRALSECSFWNTGTKEFVCQVYYTEGWRAFDYGKYELALRSFNAAEKYIHKTDVYFLCEFSAARAKLHTRMGNFDAAIKDASRTSSEMRRSCGEAYELRGDAYFAKGDWQAAIADYTSALKDCSLITQCSPNARKNRALSYLHLGETEKAIADLNPYPGSCPGYCTIDDYLLRARLYRKINQENLALADEQSVKYLRRDIKWRNETKLIYGEVKLPLGIPLDLHKLSVQLIDPANHSKPWQVNVRESSRFSFRYLKGWPVRIFAHYDGEKDGKPARFFGQTRKLTIRNRNIGPLTITLNRIARK